MTDKKPLEKKTPQGAGSTGEQVNVRKRRIVTTLLGVGGAAGAAQWSKPVINAVTLPAHAATSGPSRTPGGGGGGQTPVTTTPAFTTAPPTSTVIIE